MTTTALRPTALALLCAAALPAAAGAQEPPTGPPVSVKLSAPASVTKAKLKKGFAVTVTCEPACNASLTLSGPIGIIETESAAVAAGAAKKVTLKAAAFQVREIKRGAKLTVSVAARSSENGGGQARRTVKVR